MQAVKELSNAAWVHKLTKCYWFNCPNVYLSYYGDKTFDIFIQAVYVVLFLSVG